jgi:hypothetical protein
VLTKLRRLFCNKMFWSLAFANAILHNHTVELLIEYKLSCCLAAQRWRNAITITWVMLKLYDTCDSWWYRLLLIWLSIKIIMWKLS